MKLVRNSFFVVLVAFMASFGFAACGGDDTGDGVGEGEGEGEGECDVQTSADDICANNKAAFGDKFLEGQANLPEGFPEAPDGVELCGTIGQSIGLQVVYSVTATEEEIVTYYSDALEAAGYTIESIEDSTYCGKTINFGNGDDFGSVAYIKIHSEIIITII